MKKIIINIGIIIITSLILTSIMVGLIYPTKEDRHLKEANEFKRELIHHQQLLIDYQSVMINSLADTLWNEYNDDCPQFDGEEQDHINEQREIIDSLYKSQQ